MKSKKEEIRKQITVFSGILKKQNKFLMVLRSEKELPEAHLKWEFPGGKCDFGETPQDSLVREFREETGCEVVVKELVPYVQTKYWEYRWGTQQTLCFFFLCEYVTEHIMIEKDHHVEKTGWFTAEEIRKLDTLSGMIAILDIVADTRI